MIKDFKKFYELFKYKSGDMFTYGCVMVYPKVDNWDEITSIIDKDDIYDPEPRYGVETDPHVTILYGLHPEVTPQDVENVINKFRGKDLSININGIGKFDGDDKFNVVKLNVDSPILHDMNSELSKLPHTSDFPDYNPHMTMAYVKPGKADKYLSGDYRKEFKNIDRVVYSMPNGQKIDFNL